MPATNHFRNSCFNPRALTSPDSSCVPRSSGGYVSIHGLLRALTEIRIPLIHATFVSIHGLLRALTSPQRTCIRSMRFNPRALTSPDLRARPPLLLFYVSIHGLLRALTRRGPRRRSGHSFNPRALTSPDAPYARSLHRSAFQSTGSYEP